MTRQPAAPLVDPLLSVVMPAYNERDTIDEIIRRVLAVPLRLELIVVDDCSTDGTRDHAAGAAARAGLHADAAAGATAARARRCGPGFAEVTRRDRDHPGRRSGVLAGGVSVAHRADLRGAGRRRLRVAVPRPAPRVPVHALPGQPGADAADQRPVQHDADRHGDLLQGDARRGAAVDDAQVEPLRHRAGADGEDLQARLPRVRDPDHLRRPRVRAKARRSPGATASSPSGRCSSTDSPSD